MNRVQTASMDGFHLASQPAKRDGEQEQRQELHRLSYLKQGGGLRTDESGELALGRYVGPSRNDVEPQELKKNSDSQVGYIGLQDQGKEDPDDQGPLQKTQVDRIAEQGQKAKKKPQRASSRMVWVTSGISSSIDQALIP